jgi:DNA-binding LacI/PurR family transcriptional regulator
MKNATIKDIAKKVGVSTATVSRYINNSGYVSEEMRKKLEAAIREADYVPNNVAISLKTQKTRIIGIVIPDLFNVSFMDTVKAINDAAVGEGYQTIILNSEESAEKERKILDVLISRRVDGILVATANSSGENILKIDRKKLPIVLLDRDVCNSDAKVVLDCVANDNFNGAYQMVRYLISLGHRRIAVLASDREQPHLQARLDGYFQAMKESGIPVNPGYIQRTDLDFESGYQNALRLMSIHSDPPTAIFAFSNLASLGAISALNDLQLRIPQDVSLCGFGEFKYHKILRPDLTVVNQRSYTVGKIAAEIMLRKIQDKGTWTPSRVILPADILYRSSCAPPGERFRNQDSDG